VSHNIMLFMAAHILESKPLLCVRRSYVRSLSDAHREVCFIAATRVNGFMVHVVWKSDKIHRVYSSSLLESCGFETYKNSSMHRMFVWCTIPDLHGCEYDESSFVQLGLQVHPCYFKMVAFCRSTQ
jgi:hypothetical protein